MKNPEMISERQVDPGKHLAVFRSAEVVARYSEADHLHPAEQTILEFLADELGGMRMLDIGIGGGRTTQFFMDQVAHYTGTDFSAAMVADCIRRFQPTLERTQFLVLDARDMRALPEQTYHLALFSYNGIDCVGPHDRERIFQEVQRVAAPGGYFVFSSHNLLYLDRMYTIRSRSTWREFLYQFYRTARLYYHNGRPRRFRSMHQAVIRDGHEHFTLNVMYTHPLRQMARLQALGFRDVRMFSDRNGSELQAEDEEALKREPWIYFLCRT